MNLLWLVLQERAPAAAEHVAEPNVFALTANVSFWTLVIFLILLAVLIKFAYPPILGYADARAKRIQDALDEAKRHREETEKLLAEQREHLAAARVEAQQLIAEGRQAAERVRAELLAKAKADQEEMIARAKAEIEAERLRAVDSVRKEAVDVALAAAGRLIHQRLDAESDRRIISEFLSALATDGAGVSK